MTVFYIGRSFVLGYTKSRFIDHINYLTGASIIKSGSGEKLYDIDFQKQQQYQLQEELIYGHMLPFRSTPISALLFIPNTYFSLSNSYRISILLGVLFLLISILLVNKVIQNKLLSSVLVLGFLPVVGTINQSQYTTLLLILLLTVYLFLKHKKDEFWIGLLIGLFVLRPHFLVPAAGLFFLISKNKKKFLLGIMITLCLSLMISIFVNGAGFLSNYFNFVIDTELEKYGSWGYYFSLEPILKAALPTIYKLRYYLLINYCLFLMLLYPLFILFKNLSLEIKLSVITVLILLFGYHVYTHDLVILIFSLSMNLISFRNSKNFVDWEILSVFLSIIIFLPIIFFKNCSLCLIRPGYLFLFILLSLLPVFKINTLSLPKKYNHGVK